MCHSELITFGSGLSRMVYGPRSIHVIFNIFIIIPPPPPTVGTIGVQQGLSRARLIMKSFFHLRLLKEKKKLKVKC